MRVADAPVGKTVAPVGVGDTPVGTATVGVAGARVDVGAGITGEAVSGGMGDVFRPAYWLAA